MVCRDWASTLRRASYRGAPFFVERDQLQTGRRLVIHEFPHKNAPYVEDLGRSANFGNVTAYVHGEDVENSAGRLFDACHAGGPAMLNLPTARFLAHCEDCSRDYEKDRLGYMAFTLKFVREGSGPAPFSVGASARAIEYGASGLQVALTDAFTRQFRTLDQPGFVVNGAIDQVQLFAAAVADDIKTSLLDASKVGGLLIKADEIYGQAADLTLFGAVADTLDRRAYLATSKSQLESDLVPMVFGLFSDIQEAVSEDVAIGFFPAYLEWGDEPQSGSTKSSVRLAQNTRVLNTVVRVSAAAAYAQAIVNREYTDPRDARQARADSAEYLGALLEQMTGWETYEVYKQIYALRGQIAEHLTSLIATLAPVLIVESPRQMPSLWWANRLYGDATRATEIVKRNGIKHASFMPVEFEALSR